MNNSDPYLDPKTCEERLWAEYQKYGSLIIAYDFDNTVFPYSNDKFTFPKIIDLLRRLKKVGFHLIVFTSCNDDRLPFIAAYLKENNIPFDAINETPEFIPFKGKKVYYNGMLDDRAGLKEMFDALCSIIDRIESDGLNQMMITNGEMG